MSSPRRPHDRPNGSPGGREGMKTPHIWVVEMFDNGKWWPTVGGGLTREDAKASKWWWLETGPDDKYRITKYISTVLPGVQK